MKPHIEEALRMASTAKAPARRAVSEYENLRQKARQRALRALAEAHAEEFEALLQREFEVVGIQRKKP